MDMDKIVLNPGYKVVDVQEKGEEKIYTIRIKTNQGGK